MIVFNTIYIIYIYIVVGSQKNLKPSVSIGLELVAAVSTQQMEQRLPDDVSSHDDFRYGLPGAGARGGEGAYLKQVEDMFQHQREKYETLLGVTEDFKAKRINAIEAIARVKELFKGHDDLIFGFNAFLPKGSKITVIDDDEPMQTKTKGLDEAISYLHKVKNRFENDYHIYQSFLDILLMFMKGEKGADGVYREVDALFDDHPDLLDEFEIYCPKPVD